MAISLGHGLSIKQHQYFPRKPICHQDECMDVVLVKLHQKLTHLFLLLKPAFPQPSSPKVSIKIYPSHFQIPKIFPSNILPHSLPNTFHLLIIHFSLFLSLSLKSPSFFSFVMAIFSHPPLFGQPMVPHDLHVSLRPAIPSLLAAATLLYASAISLPSSSRLAPLFRLLLLPPLLFLAYDLSLNRRYSFGSPFRDMAFPSLGFLIFCRAVDFALVSRWDPSPAFQWIIPDNSLRKEDDEGDKHKGRLRWRKVPLPPLWSTDRLLWALDNLTLLRPGSAWVLPWRVRALEWAQRVLESPQTRFGEPEWPLAGALVQQLAHQLCHVYIRQLDLQAGVPLWTQPLHVQCALTFALGGVVAFSNALEEAILFPLLLRLGWVPRTALIASSQRAITSAGIGELWGKRWHHVWRRSFIRLARLLPGQQHQLVHAFGTFFISAAMHCWLLARLYPEPSLSRPLSFLPLIYEPGVYIFFLCQGLGTVLERLVLPSNSNTNERERISKRVIRLVWCYFVLIGSGRYVTNSLVVKGMMARKEWDMVKVGVVIRMLIGLVWNW